MCPPNGVLVEGCTKRSGVVFQNETIQGRKGRRNEGRFEKEGGKIIRLEDGWEEDFFTKHPEVARRAWWTSEKDTLGETFPTDIGKDRTAWYKDVEVVVRNQKGTNRKFVFVLNRRDLAARGTLTGPDFPKGTTFVNALTGEKTGVTFDLPGYGYRILIQD